MPRDTRKKKRMRNVSTTHNPLGAVIEEDEKKQKFAKTKHSNRNHEHDENEKDEEIVEPMLDERTSRKILQMSRDQQIEEDTLAMQEKQAIMHGKESYTNKESRIFIERDDSSDEEENSIVGAGSVSTENEDDDFGTMQIKHDGGFVTVCGEGLSKEEEAIVASMMGGRVSDERRTLADVILEKIAEKEQRQEKQNKNDENEEDLPLLRDIPPKVVEVYNEIGKILSRYTAGKLPKAFKVIPSLSNWEEVLYITRPDLWTPNAMYAATRIFASNLNPKMAQRFYNLVLLDAVRADIVANHRLNYHYYMALKKAVYKPAAFFKGILLPLCNENCTLREAAIVSSVMARVSIPVHHSAVAIHKLAQLTYSGAASIFIKTLLNKKYSLPAPVIESLVHHFTDFIDNKKDVLPVLWHQCLLVFVQRYKNELNQAAKASLRQLMKLHIHPKITPEIRRELFGALAWKEEREQIKMK